MECLTLKKANCKNCYKCIRHCPVKAIRFSGNQAYIIQDECIMCGQCFVVCPQDAKQIVSEVGKVRVMLQSGAPVVASLAPSFIANYAGSGIEEMREALKKLGFYDAEETALGATMVTGIRPHGGGGKPGYYHFLLLPISQFAYPPVLPGAAGIFGTSYVPYAGPLC